jgi:hypothetical protein
MRLTRIPPLGTSTTNTTSEFDKKAASFQATPSNQYLYAVFHLHAGRPKGRFKRSPLSPGSNDILLLPPSDPNSWTRTGTGPPARGSAPSTSPGVDLQASGLVLVTHRAINTVCLASCEVAQNLVSLRVRSKQAYPRHVYKLPRSCFRTYDATLISFLRLLFRKRRFFHAASRRHQFVSGAFHPR